MSSLSGCLYEVVDQQQPSAADWQRACFCRPHRRCICAALRWSSQVLRKHHPLTTQSAPAVRLCPAAQKHLQRRAAQTKSLLFLNDVKVLPSKWTSLSFLELLALKCFYDPVAWSLRLFEFLWTFLMKVQLLQVFKVGYLVSGWLRSFSDYFSVEVQFSVCSLIFILGA